MKSRNKFWISLFLTLVWMITMSQLIKPLNSRMIVAFEFAGSAEAANEFIAHWTSSGLLPKVYLSLYLDFVFLILYPLSIYLALLWQVESATGWVKTITEVLMKLVWIATLTDAVENFALLSILSEPSQEAATIAFLSATIKFSIVGVSLIWIIGIAWRWLANKIF